MISAIGDFCLSAAVLIAAVTIMASVACVRFNSLRWLSIARWCVVIEAVLMTAVSAALLVAMLTSDFRFEYVAAYTERALPIGYKFAAFWAGQQGSLLLWAWLLCVLCALALPTLRRLTDHEQATTLGTLAVVCGFFAALILFAANPFAISVGMVPADGRGLNPMLQDPGMIAHPPLLFMGYAGFTIPFAVLVGVLICKRTDNRWISDIRLWLLGSWLFLTAGIVLGAWWAYIELGWGGYWAWDPVENASLLPWLTATALIHSIMVQQHRGMFKRWNASLIALTFILCIFGTYITRSGVIDSVHSFAPSLIGTFFLVFLLIISAGIIGLILWRLRVLRAEHELEGLISREGAFLGANVLLLTMMIATLIGTMFPLISSVFVAEPITVNAPFYNRIVVPMAILLVAIMAMGPVLAFGKSAAARIARRLTLPAVGAGIITAGAWWAGLRDAWALSCVLITALGTFAVIVGFSRSVSARHRSTGEWRGLASIRLVDGDHRRYGGQLAHLGVMMLVIGVAGSSLFSREQVYRLHPGESVEFSNQTLTLVSLDEVRASNYTAVQATIGLIDSKGRVDTLLPQRRFFDNWEGEPNSEVAIRSNWREDLYVSLVGWEDRGQTAAIEVKVNPLVLWIWIGGIVMVAGSFLCMLPRLLPRPRLAHAARAVPIAQPDIAPVVPQLPLVAERRS